MFSMIRRSGCSLKSNFYWIACAIARQNLFVTIYKLKIHYVFILQTDNKKKSWK